MYLQNVSVAMRPEFLELLGKEHPLRVLLALRAADAPLRFGELERALELNPAQLDRALKWLHERVYVVPTTVPKTRGPIHVTYAISKRGSAFLEAFDSFVLGIEKRRTVLGEKSVRDLEALAG